MKKFFMILRVGSFLFACAALLQSCLKDTATRTYTLFTPVYKTIAEVRAGIKSNAPMPVKKPGKLFVQGNYIFLNEINKGVHIIDNTNPAAPINKYFVAIPGNLDLAVKGTTLYADNYRDLVTLDISNPASVQVKKFTEKVFPGRQYSGDFINDTSRIIVDWITKDTTVPDGVITQWPIQLDGYYEYSNVANASLEKSAVPGVSGSMARFSLLNDYLYTVSDNSLNIFNIVSPENPVFSNSIDIGWGVETIYPFKDNLFIGSQLGMFIFNTANPAQPQQLSSFFHITSCDPVIADDNFAYVTLRSGTTCHGGIINEVEVLNIQNIQAPWLIKSYPLTNPYGLAKSGNTLLICDGVAGLKVFDATDVKNLRLLQTIQGINAYDVIVQGDNAIVVAKEGLFQYNFSNRSNVILKSKIVYNIF